MKENKRYYWIKLKTDFFNQETIDFLLSQKNGCEYIVLYQMLCLKTANNDGKMCSKVGEMIIPYDVNKITRDTKYFDFDTVAIALELFKQLGLIYEEENKILKISQIKDMVGSESANANAQRQKRFRERQKQLKSIVTNSNDNNVTKNNEEYRDKSIDNRYKNIKKEINKERKYYDDSNLNNIFIEFLELRKKLKAVNSDRAINTLLNILSKYDDDTKYKMIETSIVNSWKSVYPLKENKKTPEWIDKNQQFEKMNDDELKELEEEFKQFKGE